MRGKHAHTYRPQLEALEDRRLPAVSFTLRSGVLTIRGTDRADGVIVAIDRGQVRVFQPGSGLSASLSEGPPTSSV